MIFYKQLIISIRIISLLKMKEDQFMQKEEYLLHTFKLKIYGYLKQQDLIGVEVYMYLIN